MTPIRLLVSDVDGTLVTPDKTLTPAAIEMGHAIAAAGLTFCLVSSRPARGMTQLIEALDVRAPCAAFNGGRIFERDGRTLENHPLSADAADEALDLIAGTGAGAWVFAGDEWLLIDPAGDEVWRERLTVGFEPTQVDDLKASRGSVGKIVAVSDDSAVLDLCQVRSGPALAGRANVSRSQTYYLDFTNPSADKGRAVTALAQRLGVPLEATAVIGDMDNDLPMFAVAGFSVAMGQSSQRVQGAADAVTASNSEDGFAAAVRDLILPRTVRS
ncbi:MAG TPA: HAD family hydrolase [Caulobacteraceae bacterium]|jgi:Cof subfamily protein (haloacid dehalogenase superfamily)|nr:HAD family hydrolase [Caulobacteraceae bacterium]